MTTYPVNNIYTAIQGEGVQTGVAMVLLRLQGCAVGCPWCDTKETWEVDDQFQKRTIPEALGTNPNFSQASLPEIVSHIKQHHPGPRWVLVTGGEPANHPLGPLVKILHQEGYKVALETSGTSTGHLEADFDWICVSPKIDMPGGKAILIEAVNVASEIKFVVGKPADIQKLDDLLGRVQLKPTTQICLQPLSQSPKATRLCIETVQERGWRLSIQTHKYLHLP